MKKRNAQRQVRSDSVQYTIKAYSAYHDEGDSMSLSAPNVIARGLSRSNLRLRTRVEKNLKFKMKFNSLALLEPDISKCLFKTFCYPNPNNGLTGHTQTPGFFIVPLPYILSRANLTFSAI
ncbi:MAG: hypothetical protein U0586_14390 [Candidatus Brocadiaceae bacterium]